MFSYDGRSLSASSAISSISELIKTKSLAFYFSNICKCSVKQSVSGSVCKDVFPAATEKPLPSQASWMLTLSFYILFPRIFQFSTYSSQRLPLHLHSSYLCLLLPTAQFHEYNLLASTALCVPWASVNGSNHLWRSHYHPD